MSSKNHKSLSDRVTFAAEDILAAKGYVAPLELFRVMGWLPTSLVKDWQHGHVTCLEEVMQVNETRLAEAITLLRSWATDRGLLASETDYIGRSTARSALRFSKSGLAERETAYRTHWVSHDLPEAKRERLTAKANKAPDLVVIQPLKSDWTCHKCGGTDDLLMMEPPGPACLKCVGLDDLEYLPAGDALLSRRAKAKSARFAVVVRFSSSRKQYERKGLLVEKRALAEAQASIASSI